ncbi:OmpA family protein [Siccirubricoccus soli]|uniref:OmpA family protein n=1 Tax=Siccirubricoccus soli TaxID=2899147 RepID=UPI003517DD60
MAPLRERRSGRQSALWFGPWLGRLTPVEVTGHVDGAEARLGLRQLAWARAEASANALRNFGVSHDRLVVRHMGAARPLVPVPPGTAEPQNRRVEIVLR